MKFIERLFVSLLRITRVPPSSNMVTTMQRLGLKMWSGPSFDFLGRPVYYIGEKDTNHVRVIRNGDGLVIAVVGENKT